MPGETFTLNSDDRVLAPPVTRDRSTTSKMRSLNGLTRFSPMPVVTQVTSGTVDVKISDAAQR